MTTWQPRLGSVAESRVVEKKSARRGAGVTAEARGRTCHLLHPRLLGLFSLPFPSLPAHGAAWTNVKSKVRGTFDASLRWKLAIAECFSSDPLESFRFGGGFYLRRLIQSFLSDHYCDCPVIYIIYDLPRWKLTIDFIFDPVYRAGPFNAKRWIDFFLKSRCSFRVIECALRVRRSLLAPKHQRSWRINYLFRGNFFSEIRSPTWIQWIDLSWRGESWNRARWSNTISLELCT